MPYKSPSKQREYQREWKAKRRAEWFEGKSCVLCGSTDELQIHHADKDQKDEHKVWSWAKERGDQELAKCVVLCGPCHRGHHANEQRKPPPPHGTTNRYRSRTYPCRCTECKKKTGMT